MKRVEIFVFNILIFMFLFEKSNHEYIECNTRNIYNEYIVTKQN